MATATYSASLRTRKTSSSANAKSDRACQEFYSDDYNYVGIIHFSGMSLKNKVITGISMTMTSAESGYGASHSKTVYMRKATFSPHRTFVLLPTRRHSFDFQHSSFKYILMSNIMSSKGACYTRQFCCLPVRMHLKGQQ